MGEPTATLDLDAPCSQCGYNLRGLSRMGLCPECGSSVAISLASGPTAEARWLRMVGTGSFLIGLSLLVGEVAVGLTALERRPWLLIAMPITALVGAAGTWRFATPSPGDRSDPLTWLLRLAGVATCIVQLLVIAGVADYFSYIRLTVPSMLRISLDFAVIVWSVAAGLTYIRAALLARHLKDRSGFVQACIVGTLSFGTLFVLGMISGDPPGERARILFIVLINTAGIWSTIFFLGFGIVLRRGARKAMLRSTALEEQPCPTT